MFAKVYSSIFTSSLYGCGAMKFAVMSYVIANMRLNRKDQMMQVELNPKVLADTLGEKIEDVEKTLESLCLPNSYATMTDPTNGGQLLVKLDQFEYRVVNGMKYRKLREEGVRQEQNRAAQERFRKKHRKTKARTVESSKVVERSIASIIRVAENAQSSVAIPVTAERVIPLPQVEPQKPVIIRPFET